MLHIHNGDSTANTLKEFGFPGEHSAFREVLMEGPTPSGLSPDAWRRVRATFLAEAYELKLENCEKDLVEQLASLRKFSEHDETIMWFEHDVFCQINLIYLLEWFSKQSMGKAKLSLICIGEFPGNPDFRGLGELTGEQLASLFDKRHEVSEAELRLGTQAWEAYCSSDPEELTRLLAEDTSAMPFLRNAMRLHMERFPSVRNGLGRIESQALKLISNGSIGFKSLFPLFAKSQPAYGMGDSQLWCVLKRLGQGKEPLIIKSGPNGDDKAFKSNKHHDATFELTETGTAVLAGERDFIGVNGKDLWLGGVHLMHGAGWRWNEDKGRLERSVD